MHGSVDREVMSTFIPRAVTISVMREPMVPRPPMRPTVLPASSKWGSGPSDAHPFLSPSQTRFCCATRLQLRLSISVTAMVAIASVLYVGILQTVIPFFLQASMSMLLYPVPASQMIRTDGGSRSMTLPGTGISLVMRISCPWDRSTSCSGVVSSWLVSDASFPMTSNESDLS